MQQFQHPNWLRTRQFISNSAESWNLEEKDEIKLIYRILAHGGRLAESNNVLI